MNSAFTANLEIIEELTQQFSTNSDQAKIAEVQRVHEAMRTLIQTRENNIRQTIKDMSRNVSELERDATAPEPPGAHDVRVRNLVAEQSRSSQQVSAMHGELTRVQAEREHLTNQLQDLQTVRDEVQAMLQQVEPEIRHRLSLFAHISRTTFHFEKLPRISGTVTDPMGRGGIQAFDIDPSKSSRFETVNYLWSLMDG